MDRIGAATSEVDVTLERLTPRERDVLRAYADLGSMKLVAYYLGISYQGVKNHTMSAHRKLNVNTTVQAAVLLDREERNA